MAMENYYFDEQLAKYIIQFMAIFKGLKYHTGKREDGDVMVLDVPVVYGSRDRVTASILAGNTQNEAIRLPTMSANVQNIDLAPDMRKGVGVIRRETFLPKGGLLPNDIKVVRQLMPVPYRMTMELAIYTSNMKQHRQILEQILMYFDYTVQIQKTDEHFDWTKITQVELTDVSFDENYPPGIEKRAIVSTLRFDVPIYISSPSDLKENWVKDIYARILTLDHSEDMSEVIEGIDGFLDPYELVASAAGVDPIQVGEDCSDDDSPEPVDPDANC
jgi:hypothetical protein